MIFAIAARSGSVRQYLKNHTHLVSDCVRYYCTTHSENMALRRDKDEPAEPIEVIGSAGFLFLIMSA